MKRILVIILFALLFGKDTFAAGLFFKVASTGNPANVKISLCLNAKGPQTCQNYTVSALNLMIAATPDHDYPIAGIKINSPYYSLANANCTPLANGYCMFSISRGKPAAINIKAPDYIVVGVGTAGAVLARMLSDNNQNVVVALHNGPNLDNDPLITLSKNAIITVLSGLIGPPLYNLAQTIAQAFIDDRILDWIYALPLGGASSINAGAWCRETNQVNSQWETLAGPAWSPTAIQDVYVSLENYTGQTTNPSARGFSGLLPVLQATPATGVSNTFTQAIINATGFPAVLDYNDPNTPIGASNMVQYTQMGTNGVLRASSSIAFLNNTVMDSNGFGVNGRQLFVVFNATADKVIWQGNQAVGVSYYQNGVEQTIAAAKGVIVSAGIKSSSFLMRSGVGPASLLQSLNIPVVYDNPNVGQGLADQPRVTLIYLTNPDDTPASAIMELAGNIIAVLANTSLGQQIISLIGHSVDVQNGLFSQIAWLPSPTGDQTIRALRFTTLNPIPGVAVVAFDLVQPSSRGSIVINSNNPFDEPTMDLGILSNPDDLNVLISGFQTYITNINTQLALIDSSYQLIYPDPDILNNSVILSSFIKSEINTNMHFQSHCRMAPLNQGGVVDGTGHVYGVQNLIVADDSIVPVGMDGSPMASAYLIAANIANMLLVS